MSSMSGSSPAGFRGGWTSVRRHGCAIFEISSRLPSICRTLGHHVLIAGTWISKPDTSVNSAEASESLRRGTDLQLQVGYSR